MPFYFLGDFDFDPIILRRFMKVLFFIFGSLACFLLSWHIRNEGKEEGIKIARIEAVEQGFAEWVSDSAGNTTFKWKEIIK